MLSSNKPLMTAKLNSLLNVSKGSPIYDAAYNAYYESNKCAFGVVSADDDPMGVSSSAANETNKKLKECAKNFAEEFCKNLKDGGFMDTIADEIDKHIKAMMLTINIPALLPTIVSPTGPCTGSLTISEATGAQITIS